MEIEWKNVCQAVAQRPLYGPLRESFARFSEDWPDCAALNKIWNEVHPGIELSFVPQEKQPKRKSRGAISSNGSLKTYLDRLALDRQVLTRSHSVHDIFNFLTFLLFPMTKLRIFDLHKKELDRREELLTQKGPSVSKGGRGRSRIQDMLTLFDEGGGILLTDGTFIAFGHGIYEQFVQKPMVLTAFTIDLNFTKVGQSADCFKRIDKMLCEVLTNPFNLLDSMIFYGKQIPDSIAPW